MHQPTAMSAVRPPQLKAQDWPDLDVRVACLGQYPAKLNAPITLIEL
jgi:hypothetical protein